MKNSFPPPQPVEGDSKLIPNRSRGFRDDEFVVGNTGRCGGNRKCVAVAINKNGVAIRDTKDSGKTTLVFTRKEFQVFTRAVKNGQFDV